MDQRLDLARADGLGAKLAQLGAEARVLRDMDVGGQ